MAEHSRRVEQRSGSCFEKRNRNKWLTDSDMIDGDGKHPVRWDFRDASILRLAEHRQLTNG
jgi:hypothetical protein